MLSRAKTVETILSVLSSMAAAGLYIDVDTHSRPIDPLFKEYNLFYCPFSVFDSIVFTVIVLHDSTQAFPERTTVQAIDRPSVRLSLCLPVRLSVTRLDQSKWLKLV